MGFKFIIFVIFGAVFLNAEVKDFESLKNEPKSLAKDYYIYRLLDETKYDKNQIAQLKKDIYRNQGKLAKLIREIFPVVAKKDACSVGVKNILNTSKKCKIAKMQHWFVSKLDMNTLVSLKKEFDNNNTISSLLNGYLSDNPAAYFAKNFDVVNFLNFYKYSKNKNLFNLDLDREFIDNLVINANFKTLIKDIVILNQYPKFSKSLLSANSTKPVDEVAFYLGINAIKHSKPNIAANFFRTAFNTYNGAAKKDMANFWLYLSTDDKNILKELASSSNLNMYSLYAKEQMRLFNINVVVPNPSKDYVKNYNPSNPFDWVRLKNRIDKMGMDELLSMANKFDTKQTPGEYIYIANKAFGFKDNYYPTPFLEYLSHLDLDKKSLILAIARQESRFIQSAVSISYALGMMQFMPFVANDIGKKQLKIKNFDQDFMFNVKTALEFGDIHIKYLEKYLHNPVFIAYAYNGGLGFTKKMLTQGKLFNPGKYEPFLSMELVPYAESREYGKRVLANYVIYRQILDEKSNTSIVKILKNLTQHSSRSF